MQLGLLRTLISIVSVPVRQMRLPLNTPLVARIHAQVSPVSLTPPLCGRPPCRKCPYKKCPRQAGACCRGKKHEHATKCIDYSKKPPCRKMCKCPEHIIRWDKCDPWRGTRRSKKNIFERKMAKKLGKYMKPSVKLPKSGH